MSLLPRAKIRFRRTTLLTVGLGGFLAGLGLSRLHIAVSFVLVICFGVLLAATHRRRPVVALLAVVVLGTALGLLRGAGFLYDLRPYNDLYKQKVVLRVTAVEDAVYAKNSQIGFDANGITVLSPSATNLPGRIKVAGFGENMVYRGDVVEVSGKLMPTRGGRQGQMSFAGLHVVERRTSPIDSLRRTFAAGMQSALPEPVASFGMGILIGQRNTLPPDISRQLSTVGLTHLIAVSGYNLTIIVMAVRRLTAKGSKYQSAVLSLGLIGAFLLMTGFSASIVRAAIVSALGLCAWYYGRKIKPVLLILLAAALTAGWNPLYLWSDIGWWLSFLAFFGVLVIAPLVVRRIYGEREPKFIHALLIETTCAQIMALPFILYIFQQISLVSILSNLLVVPLVPLAMLLALIAGLAGAYIPLVAGWFAWPARALLTYMLDIANVLSRVPHALSHYSLPLPGLLLFYVMIVCVIVVLGRKVAKRRDIITDTEALS